MNTEKPKPDREDRLIQYRLTPDELRDGAKLKPKLMSKEAVFAYGALAAGVSGVPGLGAAVAALEGVVNSVDGVKSHRTRCQNLKNSWVNLVNIVHKNKNVMEESELIQLLDKVVEALDDFLKSSQEWAELSWWKAWLYRHGITERLRRFEAAYKEACTLVSLAVATEQSHIMKQMREELAEAMKNNSADKEAKLRNALYEIRMDRTLDISTLPADLSIEVELLDPQRKTHNRYEIVQGRWLGTDIVALKFPMDFQLLECKTDCRGSKTICSDRFHHEKAAAAMKRFKRQVDLWRALDHPNVLRLHGWCKINGDIHLVTPWLERGNVRRFMERTEVSSAQRLTMIRDIARGLIYVHGKDVVHGSLSPTNVLVEGKGTTVTALIGDFSVSKIIPPNEMVAVTDMRDDRMMIRFQAPELILGESGPGITVEADVFAWGMTSLEIVSGVMPYNKEIDYGPLQTRIFMRRERPTRAEHPSPLWESCPGLWDLLAACWNDDCDHRPRLNDILTKLDSWIKVHEVDQ